MKRAFINWSGGKDCMMALHYLRRQNDYSIDFLFTTVTKDSDRVTMHGVRKELITRQRFALNIPSRKMYLPASTDHEKYNSLMEHEMKLMKQRGIEHAIFGDIFLEDLRKFREEQLSKVGINSVFPLWKKNTKELVMEFIESGFKAVVVCVDASKLDKRFCGRVIDENFLSDLPPGVDACGENGEYHSFVFDGPGFIQPVQFSLGETVYKEYNTADESVTSKGFWFTDLQTVN